MTKNKYAVVSGGTKGIGRAICEKLLSHGFTVFTSARHKDYSFQHNNLHQFQADFSIKSAVLAFAEEIKKHTNVVDILVNNVGVFMPGKITEEEDLAFETQINTNLASTYHLTRALIAEVKKSSKPYIFNICSTASITAYINGGSYCISKYAQLGLTKVLREELKEFKIKVSAILPGATYTDSWSNSDLPKERFIKPESIASLLFAAYEIDDNMVMEEILVRPMDGDIS